MLAAAWKVADTLKRPGNMPESQQGKNRGSPLPGIVRTNQQVGTALTSLRRGSVRPASKTNNQER